MAKLPKRVSAARILTSIENLAILEDKKRQKQAAEEEKAQRKKEREEKKQKREEEKIQRELKKQKREEEKKKKAEAKARKLAEKATNPTQRQSKRKRVNQPATSKRRKTTDSNSEAENIDIHVPVGGMDSDECCVCHGTFTEDAEQGNGSEWLQCSCGRWLHEECVSDLVNLVVDESLCPMCTEK